MLTATLTGRFSAAVGTVRETSMFNSCIVSVTGDGGIDASCTLGTPVAAPVPLSKYITPALFVSIVPQPVPLHHLRISTCPLMSRIASPCSVPSAAALPPTHLRNAPRKSGKLNVVAPSPAPKVSPNTSKSSLYISRETSLPSQARQCGGTVSKPKYLNSPT